MPLVHVDESKTMGRSYVKDPLYKFAKAYNEVAQNILTEDTLDVYDECSKVLRKPASREAMKRFFVSDFYDTTNNMLSLEEQEDMIACQEQMFENDVRGINEHSVIPDYNPIVGMSLPVHKLIMMNMVFDKGVIPKFTTPKPKFTIQLERRILRTIDGRELDFFTEQDKLTEALRQCAPDKEFTVTLPELFTTDFVRQLGGSDLDNLELETYVSAVKVENCVFEAGDILPNEEGYIEDDGKVATDTEVHDVWFRTNIQFKPNYGGPNQYDRTVVYPFTAVIKRAYKKPASGTSLTTKADNTGVTWLPATTGGQAPKDAVDVKLGTIVLDSVTGADIATSADEAKADGATVQVVRIKDTITGAFHKSKIQLTSANGNVTAVKVHTRLDTSNGMHKTPSVEWKQNTELVEIGTARPVNTTITPEESKDLSVEFNVNQLTKIMSMYKTVLANQKNDDIKEFLDNSYKTLHKRAKSFGKFDFAPREGYALDHVEWRSKTFMDFLDDFVTVMLQVLNDPNMTISVVGDPRIVRKITPKEYNYQAPSSIGPVELDYTQTIVNSSDKRLYNFVGSDQMRNTNELMIILNPRNSDRICYRIYDYQMYISNEIRNAENPTLPALHAFQRFKCVQYQPVQGRVQIVNPSGLR